MMMNFIKYSSEYSGGGGQKELKRGVFVGDQKQNYTNDDRFIDSEKQHEEKVSIMTKYDE